MMEHWIWLTTRQGLNKPTQSRLLRCFGDPEKVYHASVAQLQEVTGVTAKGLEALEDKNLTPSQEILAKCRHKGIGLLTMDDPQYPQNLREIADPPLLLYYLGTLPDWKTKPIIGAVGTRSCSDYGLRAGEKLGHDLSRGGAVVVSGMAEGVDTAVLTGVLSAEGTPVVFLAGGVDVVYPVSNSSLYRKILTRGCVLSEHPPGTKHARWNFPHRNRLISGISQGILVVEAPEKSGALITAHHARKQGREVYVVPSPIDLSSGRGSNALLKNGAIITQDAWDILERYKTSLQGLKKNCQILVKQEKAIPNVPKEKKIIDNPGKQPYIDVEKKPAVYSPREQAIIHELLAGPRLTDEIINDCGLSKQEALAVMTMLEIRGLVRRLPGNLMTLNET